MGLSFHCPQCRQTIPAAPTQMGQQVTCPKCQAQFRLSPILLSGNGQSPPAPAPAAAPVAPAAAPAATAAPPIARAAPAAAPSAPAAPMAVVAPPVASRVAAPVAPPVRAPAPSPPIAAPAAAPAAPPPNVARFIAATSQPSTVQLTAEGKLPELALAEATARKAKAPPTQVNPLVLGAVLVFSTLMSLLLLFAPLDGGAPQAETVEQARSEIAKYHGPETPPHTPYQVLLRDAQRAHTRGDTRKERECYHEVLNLLRAEGRDQFEWLTGTKSGDEELKRLLGILLSGSAE